MRGSYKSGQRRVLSGSLYKVVIGVILLVAAALVVNGFVRKQYLEVSAY